MAAAMVEASVEASYAEAFAALEVQRELLELQASEPGLTPAFRLRGGRRRARRGEANEDLGRPGAEDDRHWAPKWRRVLEASQSGDYGEFDRTVRGMLNRISVENNRRLLPLHPSLRSPAPTDDDCEPWWATRFSALMLSSYLQVIHTHRGARGLAVRSADNVLPAYLDAVSPLLSRSPRLVTSLTAWLAHLLQMLDLCWPTLRLLALAAREPRERDALPARSLGRLPGELVVRRIMPFLGPPRLPPMARSFLDGEGSYLGACVDTEDGRRDVAAVLSHLIMFAPSDAWPRLLAVAFPLAEGALAARDGDLEGRLFLAAAVLIAVGMRLESERSEESRRTLPQDLLLLSKLTLQLEVAATVARRSPNMSTFVLSRLQVAVDRGRKVVKKLAALGAAEPDEKAA